MNMEIILICGFCQTSAKKNFLFQKPFTQSYHFELFIKKNFGWRWTRESRKIRRRRRKKSKTQRILFLYDSSPMRSSCTARNIYIVCVNANHKKWTQNYDSNNTTNATVFAIKNGIRFVCVALKIVVRVFCIVVALEWSILFGFLFHFDFERGTHAHTHTTIILTSSILSNKFWKMKNKTCVNSDKNHIKPPVVTLCSLQS